LRKTLFPVIVFCFFVIIGCSAVGVPYTSDPAKKLNYSRNLFINFDRPLPAESLIKESYEACDDNYPNDDTCFAAVYMTYAEFLESDAVDNWSAGYKKSGFWDKSVTLENRFEKAIEYWFKAMRIFEEKGMFAEASNAHFNVGSIYHFRFRNIEKACEEYNQSIQSHLRFKNERPDVAVMLPKGYRSFIEFINSYKNSAGCKMNK
jgi:tetratricopeptide (TPR) repeat protein